MTEPITLIVNGSTHQLDIDPDTPLLYILRNDLNFKGPKYGCGQEQCNACKVLIDGNDVPSCKLPVAQAQGTQVTTIEGLGSTDDLHPLQESFIAEQAIQCGYCVSGMIIAAQGLLNRTRYPSDEEIRAALDENLCRCGVYDRVRRAIKLRIGRPDSNPIYEIVYVPLDSDTLAETRPRLSGSLQQTPAIDAWIRINRDETITAFTGKAEIGQVYAGAKDLPWPKTSPFGTRPRKPKLIPDELTVNSLFSKANDPTLLPNGDEFFLPRSKKFQTRAEGDVSHSLSSAVCIASNDQSPSR